MVTDIDGEGAAAVAKGLDGAESLRLDVTEEAPHAELAQLMVDTWGDIDIVAANAGFAHRMGSTSDIPTEEFDLMWAVNTRSVYFAAKHFTPAHAAGQLDREHGLDRRQAAPSGPDAVQHLEGSDDHADPGLGRRVRT